MLFIKVEDEVCGEENLSDNDSSDSSKTTSKYHNLLTALSWAEQVSKIK